MASIHLSRMAGLILFFCLLAVEIAVIEAFDRIQVIGTYQLAVFAFCVYRIFRLLESCLLLVWYIHSKIMYARDSTACDCQADHEEYELFKRRVC